MRDPHHGVLLEHGGHGESAHCEEPGDIAQLVGLQPVDEAVLLAEALLKQLLVGAVDVAEPLTQVAVITATVQASQQPVSGFVSNLSNFLRLPNNTM